MLFLFVINIEMYSITNIYINDNEKLFYFYLYNNKIDDAEKVFKEFINTTPINKFNYEKEYSLNDFQHYKDSLTPKNIINNNPIKYVITVIWINEINTKYINSNGEEVIIRGVFNENINDYNNSLMLFSKVIEMFFKNNIKIEIKKEFLPDTIIKEVKTIKYRNSNQISLTISPSKIEPYPKYISKYLDYTDVFILVLPTEQKGLSSAGLVSYSYSNKSYKKGTIVISKNRLLIPQTLIHEFIHVIEQKFKIPEKHFYEDFYKEKWPKWYKGEGQLTYYKNFIEKIILKQNIGILKNN